MRADIQRVGWVLPHRAGVRTRPARAALLVLTAVALLGAGAVTLRAPATPLDPDLVRVIRFMAAIKGGLALAAVAACFWRLARPAAPWRTAIYVAGPPVMAGASIALAALQSPALAAASLHLGLLAVTAAALTDADFIPDWAGVRRRRYPARPIGGQR